MDPAHISIVKCVMLTLQVLGLATACLTRTSQGSRMQSTVQLFFFVSLLLVGAGTIVAIGLGPGYWMASGATLSLMVVAAVCEFDRPVELDA